jgi:arylsulfatase A-like enzyme
MKYFYAGVLLWTAACAAPCAAAATKSSKDTKGSNPPTNHPTTTGPPLPNILIFLVDDMGYNQVGYNAELTGNTEIETPHIDEHAKSGIIINRGYMTPWCGPSRAALQTGRTNSYNQNVSNQVSSFDDSIGFVGGMPPGTVTLAQALKNLSRHMDSPEYKTSYVGKWGIGGTAWANTPMGMGYDEFLGFW